MKEKNFCLNFFKGIGCIGVVLVHAAFPGIVGKLITRVILWIVPLFYIISGYYSHQKNADTTLKKLPHKIKHILKITSTSILIYFIYTFLEQLRKGTLLAWISNSFTLKNILNFFILSDFDFINAGPLWFLTALIYCYLLLYVLVKYKKTNYIYYIIPLLYISRIFVPYLPSFNYHYQQNVFLGAIPNFFIGYYLSENPQFIDKLSTKKLTALIWIGILISILDVFIEIKADIFEIGVIITFLSIFLYAQQNPDKYCIQFFEKIGTKYSLFIYVMHMLVLQLTMKICSILPISNAGWYPYMTGILGTLCTMIIAIIWFKIKESPITNKILKKQEKVNFKRNQKPMSISIQPETLLKGEEL